MKATMRIASVVLACTSGSVFAATCEENFRSEGDPRNGAEFSTSASIAGLSVASALGQLHGIAAADGFKVHGEESAAAQGTLTIEQTNGRHPFLIYLTAVAKGTDADVSIRTKLNKRTVAKPEDIRSGMCGMIARIKSGAEGEAAAAAVRAKIVAAPPVDIEARWLAKEIFQLAKRQPPEIVTARYKGKRYRVDGQVGVPLETADGQLELWYKVTIERNAIMETKDTVSSYVWPPIVCRMATDHRAAAAKLREGDFAKLTGTVSHYRAGSHPEVLVLESCSFG